MITVVIPTYNNEKTIERAILSIVAQSYTDWELIVVNDCSTDGTAEVVKKYLTDPRICLITNEVNQGVGVSRKVGIDNSKGEFITFLDSDDFLRPDFLEVSTLLQKQQNADVVYTSFTVMYETGAYQVLPSGDYLMTDEATCQLHYIQPLKFLTGKLIRRTLIDKIPWSLKRVGEDVQTLLFLTYEADVVRSSSYSGYIHIIRDGSLLCNKPQFYLGCQSLLVQIEIAEYFKDKSKKLYDRSIEEFTISYKSLKASVDAGKFKRQEMLDNKKEWKQILK